MFREIGVVISQNEIGNDPDVITAFTVRAEELGFTHVVVLEHILGAVHADRAIPLSGSYDESTPFHEPLTLFSYLAGQTSRIEFLTGVLVSPQRQTALLAKQVAELDLLSKGRFRLGIGVGWNHVEYEGLNASYRTRGKFEEEQVEVMRLLWNTPVVDYTGRWHRIDRAGIAPRPTKPIPIWFGGSTDLARDRAVRIGDGFIVGFSMGSMGVALIHKAVVAAQRDPQGFGIQAFTHYGRGSENWKHDIDELVTAGATRVAVRTSNLGIKSTEHLRAIEEYAEVVFK